jgi:hypothetical protein
MAEHYIKTLEEEGRELTGKNKQLINELDELRREWEK